MLKHKIFSSLCILLATAFLNSTAHASLDCPDTLPTYTLGANQGGASWVEDIELQNDYYNKAENILLCRYKGARYQQALGFPSKYMGTFKIDKFHKEGDWKENPTLGWNVRLYLKKKDKWVFHCTGSALTPDWVLTAKHCILGKEDPKLWKIYSNKTDKSDPHNEKTTVKSFKLLSGNHVGRDVALVKLKKPLVLRKYVKSVENNVDPGTTAKFYGWGGNDEKTDTGDNQHLNERTVKISEADYEDYMRIGVTKGDKIVEGDSGGAVVYNDSVVGVLSLIIRTSKGEEIYAVDVSQGDIDDWIYKTIRLNP